MSPLPPFHVCIVDDDPMARMVAADALAGREYRITECESGEACLALFAPADPFDLDAPAAALPDAGAPDVVLLDINMPGMDGFEVCRRLRECGHEAVQVIFVSGRDDLESRLAGFDAGGSDFIVKPYSLKELHYHVTQVEAQARRLQEQAEMLSFAQKTAFSAMSSMGEMGAVLQFMRDSFTCHTLKELAARIIDAHQSYGLTVLVGLRLGDVESYFSARGECTELEISILDYVRKLGRLQQLGQRLVVNYPQVTLVVLDLPIDESEKVDRLRDHLAIIAEGAEARVLALAVEGERAAQTRGITRAVTALTATFAEIEAQQEYNRQTAHAVASQFHEKLMYAFLGMGLSTAHETRLAELAEEAMNQIAAELDHQAALAARLRETSSALASLVGHSTTQSITDTTRA